MYLMHVCKLCMHAYMHACMQRVRVFMYDMCYSAVVIVNASVKVKVNVNVL